MIGGFVFHVILLIARISSFLMVIPVLGGRRVPTTVKVGTTMALTAAWLPASLHSADVLNLLQTPGWVEIAAAMSREVVLGLLLGFAYSLIFLPMRVAGTYLAQELGLTMAALTAPDGDGSTTPIGLAFELIAVVMFLSLDLHHALLTGLWGTLQTQPIGSLAGGHPLPIVGGVAEAHEMGLMIAAPIGACLFTTMILVSVLMRLAPQFNLLSIGMGLRIGAGLLALVVFLPETLLLMKQSLLRITALPGG